MFGKRLRALRREKDLTQKELSKKLSTSDRTVGYYETEERNPSLDILGKLADFFDVSVDYLLGRTNIKNIYKYINNNQYNIHISQESIDKNEQLLKEEFGSYNKSINQSLLYDIENLSKDSKKDLEKYIQLLKLKDNFEKNSNSK
ncbi:putative HTH-type transcriptional regulator, XRE family [Gottschalkia purinilytica]|uniref:Putative HTH-type transcriptional regulator, XRE family n=1 Tax=Gottschalkia purinilytica TaxID=1503 RepID=A0A0L0WFJ3_GOTPU|nr:helix-turn-helix transcriptional regulator [Gottschalkia purinilytica]KNF10201.1 putative HTH-type transcriptional regulator, XRE family [Gottschalkia purinilytica]